MIPILFATSSKYFLIFFGDSNTPSCFMPRTRFSATVSLLISTGLWDTMAIPRLSAFIGFSIVTLSPL